MRAFTFDNDVLVGLAGPVDAAATSITVRAPVLPYRAPPAPLGISRPGVLTIVDRLSMPTAIEVITYASRVVNGDESVTLNGVLRGQQGTTARAWAGTAQAYQAPTREQLETSVLGAAIASATDEAEVRSLIGAGTGNGTVTAVSAAAPLQSSGGSTPNISMPPATSGNDGHMTAAQAAKLGGIEAGAQVNVGTNLGVGGAGNSRTLTSSTGADANLPLASDTAAGLMSLEQHTKLANIATGATAYTNAMVRAQIEAMLQNGTNVTFGFAGTGDTRTLTINASGGGGGSGSPGGPDRSIQFNDNGDFAGSEQLTWSDDFTGLVVPAVYGYQRTFVTGVLDPEVGSAAVAAETMSVTEVGGIASWQLQLRDRAGGGLVRLRLQSDDAGPQIAFGSGDFVPLWHGENFSPTQGPEVENVSGTTYDFTNADSGKYKRATSTSAKTFVIDLTVTKDRWECHIHNAAVSGDLTISGDGVDINGVADGSVVIPPGGFATLKLTGAGEFDALVSGASGVSEAAEIAYDNTTSGLAATDVQEAIDSLATSIATVAGFDDLVASLYFKRPTSTYPPIFETPYRVFGAFGASTCHSGAGRNSGKLYFECFVNTVSTSGNMGIGIVQFNANANTEMGASSNTGNFEGQWAQVKSGFVVHGTSTAYGPSYTSGDVVMVAVDFDLPSGSRKIWWGKNGLWTGDPVAGTGQAYSNLANFCMPGVTPSTGGRITLRLKASEFAYSPPTGYSAWVV